MHTFYKETYSLFARSMAAIFVQFVCSRCIIKEGTQYKFFAVIGGKIKTLQR
jgi:hypothetical protein